MDLLYSSRSTEDQTFIRQVCKDILELLIVDKEKNDTFCGVFIEGRDREINKLEDFTTLHSFKVFSKYNYPLFVFCHNKRNFLNNTLNLIEKWRINLIEIEAINSLDEYTDFCTQKLYYLLPQSIKYAVTLQPDAMLLKNGWEEEILKNSWTYIGSPWTHSPSIEYKDGEGQWRDFYKPARVGNGGFSIRDISFCRRVSDFCSRFILREKFAPNNKIPPEDLIYSVVANSLTNGVPTIQQAAVFCCDPLTPTRYFSKDKPFGFHYFQG